MEGSDRLDVPTRWADLFADGRLSTVIVLAGGTLLYAMNMYFTAALMPTIVRDIGGALYYSWVIIGFVLAAMFGTVLVDRSLERYGPQLLLLAFVFGTGATANALSANIEMLVLARVAPRARWRIWRTRLRRNPHSHAQRLWARDRHHRIHVGSWRIGRPAGAVV